MLPQVAIRTLITTVKAHLAKAAQAADKSEQHFISAGLTLKELKGRQKELKKKKDAVWLTWPDFVRTTFDLGPSRADELIRIGVGSTTVDETREAKAESMKKTRENSTPRGVDNPQLTAGSQPVIAALPAVQTPKLSEFQRVDGQIKSACDFNSEDPADVAEPGDSPEKIRRQIFLNRAAEALRHARENGFDNVLACEITDEIIAASLKAAEAWADLTSDLQRRAKGELKYA
jgi:hypothetical protein